MCCGFQQAAGYGTYFVANELAPSSLIITLGWRGTGNEEAVGRAINASNIPREDIFVTTKLRYVSPQHDSSSTLMVDHPRNIHHHCVAEALEQSLKALNVGHIDLWLMHWPIAVVDGSSTPLDSHRLPTHLNHI